MPGPRGWTLAMVRVGTVVALLPFHPAATKAADPADPILDEPATAALAASGAGATETEGIVGYGENGLEIRSPDGNFQAWLGLRAQLRSTYPFEDDPETLGDFGEEDDASLAIHRARFKSGGHVFRPWLDYYLECDLLDGDLLDLRFTLQKWKALALRVGQWKPEYNRERRDSSGELQFVERSIVNDVFTLDRQPGVSVSGRLFEGRAFDSHYWLGALSGAGLGDLDHEGRPMIFARWQWNFTRDELGFEQSDVMRKPEPRGGLALAAAENRSRYTSFSSDGGGELDGFASDVAERYDVHQFLLETAFQRRGLSLQAELHRKEISDRLGAIGKNGESSFEGGYAQAGYFFHELWPSLPESLELALRYARVDATGAPEVTIRDEVTLGANWFFDGHRNKLTADLSRLDLKTPAGGDAAVRFRLQWDVSF